LSGTFLIVGLGNPGTEYSETRHNAGFWFLDAVARETGAAFRAQSRLSSDLARVRWAEQDCVLARPTTFMNRSGLPVRRLLDYYRISTSDLLVVHDDLDLPPGTAKLRKGGGHGGHNGMRDLFEHLEHTDFLRLRLGIGHPGHKDAVTPYVLGRPSGEDRRAIDSAIGEALAVMPMLLQGNLMEAMKRLHSKDTGNQD